MVKSLDECNAELVVIERDLVHREVLLLVLVLLQLEDVVVEETLELFVRKVNAELLEGVLLENLEAEDVEDTNKPVSRALRDQQAVDLLNQPREDEAVCVLDEGQRVVLKSSVIREPRTGNESNMTLLGESESNESNCEQNSRHEMLER